MPKEYVYIVISQTGTILSRIIKRITGAKYNHASISLNKDLEPMYSFGRIHPYNPVWGGFVTESAHSGTFKRFSGTDIIVLALEVGKEQKKAISTRLDRMLSERHKYHYNYIGLVLAGFQIPYQSKRRYYCSEFVRDVLVKEHVIEEELLDRVVQPMHFLNIPDAQIIYRGKLRKYAKCAKRGRNNKRNVGNSKDMLYYVNKSYQNS